MKRFSRVFGTVLGLVGLGILTVVLILTFSSLRDKEPTVVSRATRQSPTPLETRKPTPLATLTPEDETFRSPLPTPTMTSTPEPSPTASPTPPPTPTPAPLVTVVPGPLLPGPKIVCMDKGEDDWMSVIWMANVDDLEHVQILARFENRVEGWRPEAHLSPDGRYIAYEMPREPRSQSILGILSIDGSENRVLDESVASPGVEWHIRWSRDSQWIAYVRDIWSGRDRVGSEIWVIRADGTEKRLLASEEYVFLLGWSRDNSHIYYAPGGQDLWAVDIEAKAPPFELLHFDEPSSPMWLSPDGEKVIYETLGLSGPAPVTLGAASIDGREKHVLAEGIDARGHTFPNYTLSPIWSPDSARIVYNLPTDKTQTEVLSIRWNAREDVVTVKSREKAYYRPLSWSPDGRFIATWRYPLDAAPDAQMHMMLLSMDGSLQRVYSIDPTIPLPELVGWLEE